MVMNVSLIHAVELNGRPADKRDLMAKAEKLQMMHILKILSVQSHS